MNRFTKHSSLGSMITAPVRGTYYAAAHTGPLGDAVGYGIGSAAGGLQSLVSSEPSPEYSRAGRAIKVIEEAEQLRADARVLLTRAKMELAKRKAREASAYRSLRTGML